ncbi:hypothetical protein GN244_ATG21022 [Phytophthora infestans]|uniref:Uncharacterized protein n=1 Tax=Phytophthora infestans TaxID=4787 RepID=A0A833SNA5_PHYIN|nr:hypothetical protein GN244_ATG21022 [Phytophthora infestans]
MVGPTCKQCEGKIDPLLLNPQRSTTDSRARCVCCGKLQYGYAFRTISGRDIMRRCIACENGPKAVEFWGEKPPPPDSRKAWQTSRKRWVLTGTPRRKRGAAALAS